MQGQNVLSEDWGTIPYQTAWDRQENVLREGLACKLDPATRADTVHRLVLCEHPHVYTLGKSGKASNLLANQDALRRMNATFVQTNRGGDITYHGPGQVVGYPLLDLEKFRPDLGWYMRSLEEVIIRVIAHYGLNGARLAGATGVWLDAEIPGRERKICAMGVRCSRWLTMHGFALNVNSDLDYFRAIVPCGITDKGVTSIAAEAGRDVSMEEVKDLIRRHFEEVFDCRIFEEAGNGRDGAISAVVD